MLHSITGENFNKAGFKDPVNEMRDAAIAAGNAYRGGPHDVMEASIVNELTNLQNEGIICDDHSDPSSGCNLPGVSFVNLERNGDHIGGDYYECDHHLGTTFTVCGRRLVFKNEVFKNNAVEDGIYPHQYRTTKDDKNEHSRMDQVCSMNLLY